MGASRMGAEELLREAESKYRALVEQIPAVTYLLDLSDGIDRMRTPYVSPQVESLLGVPASDLIGDEDLWREVLHPDDSDEAFSTVRRAVAEGEDYDFEYRMLRRDGDVVWVRDRAATVQWDEAGWSVVYHGVLFDITERKLATEELASRLRREEGLAALGELALATHELDPVLDAAVGLLASSLGVEYAKVLELLPGGEHLLLRSGVGWREGLVGAATVGAGLDSQAGYTLVSDHPVVVEDLRTDTRFSGPQLLHEHGVVSGLSVIIRGHDGPYGVLGAHTAAARAFGGHDVHFLQAVANVLAAAVERVRLDLTVQQHAEELEQRVAERTAELAETNAELEAFSYTVAHDLRAPLRAMEGFSTALVEDYGDRLDEDGRDYAERIVAASNRMELLIQDLLAYARLSRSELRPQPVALSDVVAEVLSQLEAALAEAGAEVSVEEPLPTLMAHPATTVQAVANLVANAVKFVAPGVTPRVRVRAVTNGATVRLWVEDNGIGLKPEHLERIFRVFERLHSTSAYPGTGIGLAVVRKGVERMGGHVGVESEVGGGSRFWIELPLGGRP